MPGEHDACSRLTQCSLVGIESVLRAVGRAIGPWANRRPGEGAAGAGLRPRVDPTIGTMHSLWGAVAMPRGPLQTQKVTRWCAACRLCSTVKCRRATDPRRQTEGGTAS